MSSVGPNEASFLTLEQNTCAPRIVTCPLPTGPSVTNCPNPGKLKDGVEQYMSSEMYGLWVQTRAKDMVIAVHSNALFDRVKPPIQFTHPRWANIDEGALPRFCDGPSRA